MSGALQAVFQNQRSFTIPLPAAIGAAFGGGFFAGQISTSGNGTANYNLVVGPKASAQSFLRCKVTASATTGTSSVIDGPTNSSNMNNSDHPAAEFCEGLTIGGFSDWYMPAQNELEVCYFNLKPSTASNSAEQGANANSVPARGDHTSGTPAQTSSTDFQASATEAFNTSFYWTSTQSSADTTRQLGASFFNGSQYSGDKNNNERVRAIRRVAV